MMINRIIENLIENLFVLVALLVLFAAGLQIGNFFGRRLEAKEVAVKLAIKDIKIKSLAEQIDKLKKELKKAKKARYKEGLINAVIQCESGGRHKIWGRHGEYGIAQFKRETFYHLAFKAGLKDAKWKNRKHQIYLLRWGIEHGYGHWWTCYQKVKNRR